MKTQRQFILTILIALAALLLLTAPVAAQAAVTAYNGNEVCVPRIPGTITLADGNTHIRGMVLECTDTGSDSRASGINTVVMNANWDDQGQGPMWGTWSLVNAGGTWEGTWEGMKRASGSQIHGVGTGLGSYEGLKLVMSGANGVIQGFILDPHGN